MAYLRKGETYADLACGFEIGTSTVYRYVREALTLLATMAPTLAQAIEVARRKAFVILDGTLLRIDRVGMASGRRAGQHRAEELADPAQDPLQSRPGLRARCRSSGPHDRQHLIRLAKAQ